MRWGGGLGWRLLVAVAIAAGWWAVATDATLIDGARHAWAFMTVVGVVAGIPGLLIIKALVREVPLLLLAAAVLVGAGPAVACVRALGPVYQLQGPVDIGVLLLHAGTLPPLVEESVKSLGITAVLLALGPVLFMRRHGKAIGAAVGLGFTISEVATYAAGAAVGDTVVTVWGQLVLRMGLLGLTGHALTGALAGVGVADALGARGGGLARRGRLLAPWLALAIIAHGLMNTLGAGLLAVVSQAMAPAFDTGASTDMPLQAVWLGMVASVIGAQLWAVAVLWRWGHDSGGPNGLPLPASLPPPSQSPPGLSSSG
jgi:RsiW-degrading membrane proteinase PrsW (M82 family)